jgi:hypothetical protein
MNLNQRIVTNLNLVAIDLDHFVASSHPASVCFAIVHLAFDHLAFDQPAFDPFVQRHNRLHSHHIVHFVDNLDHHHNDFDHHLVEIVIVIVEVIVCFLVDSGGDLEIEKNTPSNTHLTKSNKMCKILFL